MATAKPRTLITVDDEMYQKIDDFRFNNRFPSRSAAINELIRRGMEAIIKEREAEAEPIRVQLEAAKDAHKG